MTSVFSCEVMILDKCFPMSFSIELNEEASEGWKENTINKQVFHFFIFWWGNSIIYPVSFNHSLCLCSISLLRVHVATGDTTNHAIIQSWSQDSTFVKLAFSIQTGGYRSGLSLRRQRISGTTIGCHFFFFLDHYTPSVTKNNFSFKLKQMLCNQLAMKIENTYTFQILRY
jgi:hypothetical protein